MIPAGGRSQGEPLPTRSCTVPLEMARSLLPRLAFALFAALGLAGQSATSLAHALAHREATHVSHRLRDNEHHLRAGGDSAGPSSAIKASRKDLDHSVLHAAVGVAPVANFPEFVASERIDLSDPPPIAVVAHGLAFEGVARPPGLSAPPPTSRGPPIA
jgi:hypothetical protein